MTKIAKLHYDNLPDDLVSALDEFFKSIKLDFTLVDSAADADVTIDKPSEKEISETNILHSGGRVSCPVAFAIAKKLGISHASAGKLNNVLDIKIFGCQLGCFK